MRLVWDGVTKATPGCGQYGYAVQLGTDGLDAAPESRFPLNQASGSVELAITAPCTELFYDAFTDRLCSAGALLNVQTLVLGTQGTCAYGTRLKVGSVLTLILGQTGLGALLARFGVSWWEQFVVDFAFTAFDLDALCSTGPGPLPVVDTSSVAASVAFWRRCIEYLIWLDHCECIPGTPTPIVPAPPSSTEPPGWPPELEFPCAETDICAALDGIAQQVAALARSMATVTQTVTLLQRYQLPFAYIRGATHAELGESGSFAVSRLLGMEFDVTEVPAEQRVLEGVPPYVWDLGWISIMDGQGFIEEKRLTRGQMIWLPKMMPEAVSFGWFFKEGVRGTFTELMAEP